MTEKKSIDSIKDMLPLAMDSMGVAITIIDSKGTMLYYNKHAEKILDRKPEYIGKDIHLHHNKTATNEKFDRMLKEFQTGRTDAFHYEAEPYGEVIHVTLTPIRKDGVLLGCVQAVQLKEDIIKGSKI
jgi:PAS domain S-box-containing protein